MSKINPFLHALFLAILTTVLLVACGGGSGGSGTLSAKVELLSNGLVRPWGIAFLPDRRILISEKGGGLVLMNPEGTTVLARIGGLPAVDASGQGGMLDVALDPEFTIDPWIYWSFTEPGVASEVGLSGTAVARGRLVGGSVQDIEVIYRQVPKVSGAGHFGSRLVFRGDGTLYVTLGERQLGAPAQDLATTLGKVVRIQRDGSVPADNPQLEGPRPEIWSYGHRNPQGGALRPGSDDLWISEHGPQGGDEINRVVAGGNYGWPLVSYGCQYGDPIGASCRIGGGVHAPDYVEPTSYWVPVSIAPAGMVFYTGGVFPEWQGDLFVAALAGQAVWRVELDGVREAAREELFHDLGERFRDVEQGPDGLLYLITDNGKLFRVSR